MCVSVCPANGERRCHDASRAAHPQTDIPAVCRSSRAPELATSSVPYSVKCGLNSLSSPTYLECEVRGGEGEGRHVTKIRR